jgi:hypothetical protein
MNKINQITDGSEFLLDGKPYVGFYNLFDGVLYTGRSYDSEQSELLQPISENVKEYNLVKQGKIGNSPTPVEVKPKSSDYSNGWFYRYFVKRKNNENAPIIEVDEKQYSQYIQSDDTVNYPLYKTVKLRWKITGPRYDVIENGKIKESGVEDTNKRTVLSAEKNMSGIRFRLNHLTQYYENEEIPFDLREVEKPPRVPFGDPNRFPQPVLQL